MNETSQVKTFGLFDNLLFIVFRLQKQIRGKDATEVERTYAIRRDWTRKGKKKRDWERMDENG